jgi:hypothetical protein
MYGMSEVGQTAIAPPQGRTLHDSKPFTPYKVATPGARRFHPFSVPDCFLFQRLFYIYDYARDNEACRA